MAHNLTHPGFRLAYVYHHLVEIGITILLMMGAYPIFKEVLVYLLMKLYEIFIQYPSF